MPTIGGHHYGHIFILSASDLRSAPDSGITHISFPQHLCSAAPGSATPAGVSDVPFNPCGLTWSGVIHRWSCSRLMAALWSLVSESAGSIAYWWWILGAMRQSCTFVSTAAARSYTNTLATANLLLSSVLKTIQKTIAYINYIHICIIFINIIYVLYVHPIILRNITKI